MTTDQPTIFRMLDLSTAHLPEDVCSSLSSYDGVIATEREYGWLLYVPNDIGETAADYGDDIPVEVVNIWRFAARHDCQYVLFDSDAGQVDDLPTWSW